jgi:hypothetical protein
LTVFLSAGSTFMSGSVAATRIRALVPGAPAIFAIAAFVYYGIESLEGHGIEIGLPTIVLAIFATVLAYALRTCAKAIARIVITLIRDGFARLARREPVLRFALEPQRIHSQTARAARRLGRAPPNERRLL